MGIKFGSFDEICETAALVICPLIGNQGVEPTCYSRNVDLGGTLLFQPCASAFSFCSNGTEKVFGFTATVFVHVVAIIMTIIMILHIRSKYTAVGRKEILTFFYLYAVIQLLAIFLDGGIIPTSSAVYQVRLLHSITFPESNISLFCL